VLTSRGGEAGESDQALHDTALISTRLTNLQPLAKECGGPAWVALGERDVAQVVQHTGAQLVTLSNEPSPARLLDLIMLANSPSGQERTVEEYRDLLGRADFHLERVVPAASPVSVIEAFPA
jgi:hypothetical protein